MAAVAADLLFPRNSHVLPSGEKRWLSAPAVPALESMLWTSPTWSLSSRAIRTTPLRPTTPSNWGGGARTTFERSYCRPAFPRIAFRVVSLGGYVPRAADVHERRWAGRVHFRAAMAIADAGD